VGETWAVVEMGMKRLGTGKKVKQSLRVPGG